MDAEVGVIGIGTMGSMAILELTKRKKSVIGFEKFWIGHDRSAGAGDTRLFRTPHNQIYKTMFEDAYSMWRELEDETSQQLIEIGKALIIGESESEFIKNVINNFNDYGTDYNVLNKLQAETRYPQHKLLPNEVIIVEENAGFVRPELSIMSVTERAKELGAIIKSHSCVDRIETHNDVINIWSNGQVYKVKKLVITAGPWTNKVLGNSQEYIAPKRLISTWFLPKNGQEFIPDNFPVFIRMNKEFGLYGTPSVEGSWVKVSIRNEHISFNDADMLDRNVSTDEMTRISSIIEKALPDLYSTPARVSVYMDGYTEDGRPIISKLPENENIVLLGGYSGHGFKLAPVMGKIAADLVLDGQTSYPIESFSFSRMSGIK